jgi:hypothetical protein
MHYYPNEMNWKKFKAMWWAEAVALILALTLLFLLTCLTLALVEAWGRL